MLGYPGVGQRTVGAELARLLDGVLVDNALINRPLLTLFKWDGKALLPTEIWDRVVPIREAVLGTIEDLAPKSHSHVFTNVLEDDEDGAVHYESIRSLAQRRGSLFLAVVVDCDIDEEVRRIDTPDRIARLKGSDPEGYRRYRLTAALFQPPREQVVHINTTATEPRRSAEVIYDARDARARATRERSRLSVRRTKPRGHVRQVPNRDAPERAHRSRAARCGPARQIGISSACTRRDRSVVVDLARCTRWRYERGIRCAGGRRLSVMP